MWMECGNDECDVWMPNKAQDGWSGEKDEFMCGPIMVNETMKLKREIEDLKTKMVCMKSIDEERESNYETSRKKRMIVFNLKEKKEKNDRDRVIEIIGEMGVRVIEEEYVVRMRNKDEGRVN